MTKKQALARDHNWGLAIIKGSTTNLVRLCYQYGLSGTAAALKGIRDKMEKEVRKEFKIQRAKL